MKIQVSSKYSLRDGQDHYYGDVLVTELRDPWVMGKFEPGSDFQLVAELFRELEQLANDQILSLVDLVVAKIDALGFRLASKDNFASAELYDVQIMNITDICFKVKKPV